MDQPETFASFDDYYDRYIQDLITSKITIDNEDFKKRNLRGAVCEYLDGNDMDVFLLDLYDIMNHEYNSFTKKAKTYKNAMDLIRNNFDKHKTTNQG